MNTALSTVFSFSIAIAAAIGWIRFKKINPAYYPFLVLIWVGLLNEILNFFIIHAGNSNAINCNIYALAESILILWQFKKWDLFQHTKSLFVALLISFLLFWIIEGLFIRGINNFIAYFRVYYSFVVVLMSINIINQELVLERKSIFKNPSFLICIGFLSYFSYKIIVWSFWLYGLSLSNQFMKDLTTILFYINLFTNLTYALAVLWMPIKHRFLLPF